MKRLIFVMSSLVFIGCASVKPSVKGQEGIIKALRLTPGQDLRQELNSWAKRDHLKAATLISAVGSLNSVTLRFANQKAGTVIKGPLEIVGVTGTLSEEGMHVHLAVADSSGKVIGGHLMEGSQVYTTVELVVVEAESLRFLRQPDKATGYKELVIEGK